MAGLLGWRLSVDFSTAPEAATLNADRVAGTKAHRRAV
jgi:hypothetical protein